VVVRYRLLDPEGEDLGPFVSSGAEWQPGHTIQRGPSDFLRITAVVEPEDGADFRAYLVVEQVARIN
jgi:hypothetical protein